MGDTMRLSANTVTADDVAVADELPAAGDVAMAGDVPAAGNVPAAADGDVSPSICKMGWTVALW